MAELKKYTFNSFYTMEFVPKDVSLFRSSVDALKEFLPTAQLCFSKDGLGIRGMDPSHVGFVDYFLAAEDCTKADLKTSLTIGVHMSVLAKVLSPVGAGDSVTLTYNKKAQLVVTCYNAKVAKKAVYEISTLDIDDAEVSIPGFEYGANVTLKTGDLYSVIKELSHFGEKLDIRLDEHGLHLGTQGDHGNVNQTLENTEDREMTLNDDSVTAAFGIKYILMILKGGGPQAATMQLEFDPAHPMKCTFRFGERSYFIAYLAPKTSDDVDN